MDRIALIILASGNSTRFGPEDKLMAQLHERPMIDHIMELGTGFAHRIAVVQDGPIMAHMIQAGFTTIINPNPDAGQGSSIALGAKMALEVGAVGAVFVLGDMPFVTSDYLAELIAASNGQTIASDNQGQLMPPIFFDQTDLERLTLLPPVARGKDVLGADIKTHTLPEAMARDIDTPDDLNPISPRV